MRKMKIVGYGSKMGDNTISFGGQRCHRMREGGSFFDLIDGAVEEALRTIEGGINSIDCIVAAMATPLQLLPCSAALIHERHAAGLDIPAMDINTSCTSFITALDLVSYLLEAGRYKRVLIVSGDFSSAGLNTEEKESYELFSDAAAAVAVEYAPEGEAGIIYSRQKTWSTGAHDTEIYGGGAVLSAHQKTAKNEAQYYFQMKGLKVLRLSAKVLPDFINSCFKMAGMERSQLDWVIPHQASSALPLMMSRLGFEKDHYINRVRELGNMVSASIPFVLCQLLDEGSIKRGEKILLVGTAAGFSASFMILQY